MKRFVARVAVWRGLVPRTNSGWVVVERGGVRIYDGRRELLGEATMDHVRWRRTRFAWGATTVWLGDQRFMLSQGGAAGVPADGAGDLPDFTRTVESAALLQDALEKAAGTRE